MRNSGYYLIQTHSVHLTKILQVKQNSEDKTYQKRTYTNPLFLLHRHKHRTHLTLLLKYKALLLVLVVGSIEDQDSDAVTRTVSDVVTRIVSDAVTPIVLDFVVLLVSDLVIDRYSVKKTSTVAH